VTQFRVLPPLPPDSVRRHPPYHGRTSKDHVHLHLSDAPPPCHRLYYPIEAFLTAVLELVDLQVTTHHLRGGKSFEVPSKGLCLSCWKAMSL
jgi:hypothetical protein